MSSETKIVISVEIPEGWIPPRMGLGSVEDEPKPSGVWVAYYWDFSDVVPFANEWAANDFANKNGMVVRHVPWSHSVPRNN